MVAVPLSDRLFRNQVDLCDSVRTFRCCLASAGPSLQRGRLVLMTMAYLTLVVKAAISSLNRLAPVAAPVVRISLASRPVLPGPRLAPVPD